MFKQCLTWHTSLSLFNLIDIFVDFENFQVNTFSFYYGFATVNLFHIVCLRQKVQLHKRTFLNDTSKGFSFVERRKNSTEKNLPPFESFVEG